MKPLGTRTRTLWETERGTITTLDQTLLPHKSHEIEIATADDAARAIRTMQVRGAPLIGVTAAYGLALALKADASDATLNRAVSHLASQRPTAVNLAWALQRVRKHVEGLPAEARAAAAWAEAGRIADEDVASCAAIGSHGLALIEAVAARKKPGERVNVLTHCNAGALACIDWGTATAPIYMAHAKGLPVHVWVDETRPRGQGALLTALELGQRGVPHTIIADNAGGHLMQHAQVDLVIVGADRVTANGDAANKIGTYLKALAAVDNGVPFYVAMPSSTIDWGIADGFKIPIEERGADEVLKVTGRLEGGDIATVSIAAEGSPAANPAFDVTPARLVTGLVTERGICKASREGLLDLYPERRTMKRA